MKIITVGAHLAVEINGKYFGVNSEGNVHNHSIEAPVSIGVYGIDNDPTCFGCKTAYNVLIKKLFYEDILKE